MYDDYDFTDSESGSPGSPSPGQVSCLEPLTSPSCRITLEMVDEEDTGASLIDNIAGYLQYLADKGPEEISGCPTVFDASAAPDLTVNEYLWRLYQWGMSSERALVVAAIYIERCSLVVSRRNIHRLLLAAFAISAKYLDDWNFRNSFYAKVGGVHRQEINRCEEELLSLLDWRLIVTMDEYTAAQGRYSDHALSEVAGLTASFASRPLSLSHSSASTLAIAACQAGQSPYSAQAETGVRGAAGKAEMLCPLIGGGARR